MSRPPSGALEALLAPLLERGPVLAIGAAARLAGLELSAILHVDAADPSELEAALSGAEAAGPSERARAAVIGAWGDGLDPRALAARVGAHIAPGGCVVFVVPTRPAGRPGVGRALLNLLGRAPAMELEELCEAMLLAGLDDIRAEELGGRRPLGVVWARVPG